MPPPSSARGVHLEGDEFIKVPKRTGISTGNADAWGAPAVTSSPGGGDNNPPDPGEPPLNGYTTAPKSTITSCCLIGPEREEPAGQVDWRLDCLPSVDRLAHLLALTGESRPSWASPPVIGGAGEEYMAYTRMQASCHPPFTHIPPSPLPPTPTPITCHSLIPYTSHPHLKEDQSHTFTWPTL